MPKFEVQVSVDEIAEALEFEAIPHEWGRKSGTYVDFTVEIDQSEVDDKATEEEPVLIEADTRDLRDGLRALLEADLLIASTLLIRAFDEQPSARTVVEEEIIRARSVRRKAA